VSTAGRFRELLDRPLAIPALLALASGAGLVTALVSDGARDLVACAGIGLPLAAITWARLTRTR
jgi:hypothetical protein